MISKKHLKWLGVALAAFYVLKQPNEAAAWINNAAAGLGDAAGSLATFVNSLAT